MQHDVQEFNRVLQEKLEAKMKVRRLVLGCYAILTTIVTQDTAADGAITKLFVGKMKSYVKCVNVDYESSRNEDFYGGRCLLRKLQFARR